MPTPLIEGFEQQLAGTRKKSEFKKLLASLLEAMVQLDSGMVAGRIVPEAERRTIYDQLRALADRAFKAFTDVDDKAAHAWAQGIAVWERPKNLDLSAWTSRTPGTESAAVAAMPTDEELGATVLFKGTILDDDGVAVLASQNALTTRYSSEAFDYEFPRALLQGMAARELISWKTGSEGEHAVTVERAANPVAFKGIAGPETTPVFSLEITPADSLLILPYSQFTSGCSSGGKFKLRGRLGAAVSVEAGRHAVRVVRNQTGERGGASFRVLLCASSTEASIVDPGGDSTDLPGWSD